MNSAAARKEAEPASKAIASDPMGRPRKPRSEPEVVLSVRIDKSIVDDLDRVADTLVPNATLSRTQVVRMALREWLDTKIKPRK